MESDKEMLQYVAELAAAAARPGVITSEAEHFAVVPAGMELRSLRDFQHAEPPVRKSGDVKVRDVAGFAHYYKLYSDEDSLVFGDPSEFTFTGTLDYHMKGSGAARARRHKVTLRMEQTQRWITWKNAHGKAMAQEEFATFIEDNLADIYVPSDQPNMPSAADMLEVSRSLEASTSHVFKQSINLKNGQRGLQYNEQINGVAGPQGEMAIPDEFVIRVPVFLNQHVCEVRCRLRFRITGGKLSMWFAMIRVDEMLAAEFKKARCQVEEVAGCVVVLGQA